MQRRRPRPAEPTETRRDWHKVISTAGAIIGAFAGLTTALWRLGIIPTVGLAPTATQATASVPTQAPTSVFSSAAAQTHSPPPTPAAAPQPSSTMLEDGFSDSGSGWATSMTGDTESGYSNGVYRIAVNATDLVAWENTEGHGWSNVLVLADVRRVAGPFDNQFGLLVRYVDRANFYAFWISSDGMYAVQKLLSDDWVDLVEWTESPVVRQGDRTNILRVECEGSEMRFVVNDELLAAVEDSSFAMGDVGLAAGSFDEPGVVVHFDNLLVRPLLD